MPDVRVRYCQRCSTIQTLVGNDEPRPCRVCGSVQFGFQPRLHSNKFGVYRLDKWFDQRVFKHDRDFLRVQGIDSEGE